MRSHCPSSLTGARPVPDATLYTQARGQLGAATAALRAASTPTAKLEACITVLRIIGTMAANAPTPALRDAWLAQYRILQPKSAALRAQVTDSAPGAVLRELDKFSDSVLTFGGQVLDGAGAIVTAPGKIIGALTAWLPLILVLGVVGLVWYYGKAYKVAVSRRGK